MARDQLLSFLKFFFLCLLLYGMVWGGIYHLNARFCIANIKSTPAPIPVSNPIPLSTDIGAILLQKFTFLSQGSQMYVFESADHAFVLKFLKHHRYRLPKFLLKASVPLFQKEIMKRRCKEKAEKLEKLYESCSIAATELKESCGLVYTHLNLRENHHLQTTLIDKLGRSYQINLDEFDFLLQKKCSLIIPTLAELIEKSATEEAKRRLHQILKLLDERFQKGIDDSDCMVSKNIGFSKTEALYIDIGQFSKSAQAEEHVLEKKIQAFGRLQKWLRNASPTLSTYLSETLR